ncbi:alpha-2-macroglobulin family protein [Noviherbaspirillum galbum]|uniref:Alpha-2-macroglobulin family protein n=1 Tax=Noviherbaspirillum galbum TaxID=2709383 RepID=A0A6B3SIL2_9BURK|nr:alpha-2-macroglobulin [Noviherbaspirillum galbum]NEX60667.1 alpha-2-macroglobulin family protein [Noviherbaspirillum galbum]
MRKKIAGVVVLVFLLVAAAFWWFERNKASDSTSSDPNASFTLVDAADRSLDGAPALALSFSLPLDPRTSYDKFIRVYEMPSSGAPAKKDDQDADDDTPRPGRNKAYVVSTRPEDTDIAKGKIVQGAWVVGDNPRLLFFPHIKPETRYVVQVQVGLPAKGGKTLAEESRYSVLTAPVSPAYYFASNGMVLPARQNGGLPVVTVNVPEVDVQFLRVKNDQLPRFLDRVIAGAKPKQENKPKGEDEEENVDTDYDWRRSSLKGAVQLYQLDDLRNMTDSVYLGRFLTEQKENKRGVTYIPVEDIKELQEPGVYVAVMSQPGRFRYDYQATYFYVSDLGLHLRQFSKSADAFVSSLTDGRAIRGVEVSWLDNQGKVLGRAETDGEGHAVFPEQPKNAKVVIARKDKQVSLLALKEPALDLSEYDITGAPYKPVRLFAYSGRNLYRPGETFDLSVLARDADGRPVPSQPVQAVLKRPDGKSQFTATWKSDERFPGYYLKRIDLPADAPTGFWTLELRNDPADKVPGTSFRFGVEEFLPERMKLDLASKQALLSPDDAFDVDVGGSYLYGAPASGNRLLAVAQFERNKNPLAKVFPGFEFGDANDDDLKSRKELEEQALDEQGKGQLAVDLSSVAERRSPVTVRATVSLLESGGRPVVRSIERVLWPADVIVGIRPLFTGDYAPENSPADFEVVRADKDGKLKPAASMPVRLFRENREYYWRFEDQRGWTSGFTETDELVDTSSVSVPAGGRGKLRLPVRYGRYRIEITDPETNLQTVYRFYVGWSARTDESQGVRPDRVALKLDKAAYRDGDTVHLTINPPHAGEALVTVEGDRTLWTRRISVSGNSAALDIPLDPEWKRHDLYVTVLVLRPGNEGDRVTPARALGIAHLPLDRANRKLDVTLEAPQKALPETSVKVRVKAPAAKGQQAFVTLSAVDAGILNITRFASPDPHGFFFGKLRYGPDQHDIYGRLIEKMQGQKGKLKFGGDNTPKPTRSLPKKVKLVDLFSGPVKLNEQGEADITLNLPDFNGTLRLMAVVAAPDRFGAKDAEMTVAAPLVAELATPRFLSFGDTAMVALDLHNLSGATKQLKVGISGGEGLAFQDAERSLTLKDQQKQTLRFPVEAKGVPGLHTVTVKVNGEQIKLERVFGLTVQAPTPQQQISRRFSIKPGETLDIRDAELSGLHRGSVSAHLSLSNKAPIDVRSAIQGLLTYPYGCAEQTTSTAYPHVFIDEDAARRFGLKPFSREKRVEMLDQAVARLGAMQAPNGGFSLWGNMSEYEYWLSAYVTAFLQDAREQGFGVPDAMYSKAMDFLLRGLQEGVSRIPAKQAANPGGVWQGDQQANNRRFGVLAYGGYVLAREKKVPLATLRQLYESREQAHSGLALVQLGIALKLMGDHEKSEIALKEGVTKPRDSGYWWWDYGSPLRDAALSYALLERHQLMLDARDGLINTMVSEMESHRYTSTQEKLALFLVGRAYTQAPTEKWTATIAGARQEDVSGTATHFREVAAGELVNGLKIANTSKEKLYVELSMGGNPVKQPAARNDPIELSRSLHAPDGSAIGNRTLKVGESVLVHVTVKSRTLIGTGMVVDRIPAGLEIENQNIVQGEQMGAVTIAGVNPVEAMRDARIQHVEFRDDRFVAAARLDYNVLHLFYRARVVTPGKFVVPPLYAEDMYRPDLYGLTGGSDSLIVAEANARDPKKAEGK